MKITQWFAASIAMLLVACSSTSFSPSEEFAASNKAQTISIEGILEIAQKGNNIADGEQLSIKGWPATSDQNIAKDVSGDPELYPVDSFDQKLQMLGKISHDGINYILISDKEGQHLWLGY